MPALEDAVGTVDDTVNGLVGPEGLIASTVASLDGLLNLLSVIGVQNPEITVTLETDLQGALQEILATPLGEGTGVVVLTLQ